MGILKEEAAQAATEYLLLLGGVIVIAIVAAILYRNYVYGAGKEINSTDVQNVNDKLGNLSNKFH